MLFKQGFEDQFTHLFGLSSNVLLSITVLTCSAVKEQGESTGSLSSTASTPGSGASMAESSGSTRVALPTRKRSHSKHLDAELIPFEGNKSRRTSPSPFATSVTTPSGSSGYGYTAIGDGYFDLTMFVPHFTNTNELRRSFIYISM